MSTSREFSDEEVARIRRKLIEAGIVAEDRAPAWQDLPQWQQQQWQSIAQTYVRRFFR